MVSAVSILSPVIIQKFMPASIKSSISVFTLSCNLSSKADTPNKIELPSICSTIKSNCEYKLLSLIALYFISSYSFIHKLYSFSSKYLKL